MNNIILVRKDEEWRIGYLIDWELSTKVGKSGRARDHDRAVSIDIMSPTPYSRC